MKKDALAKVLVNTYFNVNPTEKQTQLVELLKHQSGDDGMEKTFYYHKNGKDVTELTQHIFQGDNHFNLTLVRYEYYTYVKENSTSKIKPKKK